MHADSQVGRHLFDRLLSFPSIFDGGMKNASFFKVASVTGCRMIDHDGLLYNFETDSGLIIANGIVTHNCRCRARAVVRQHVVDNLRRRVVPDRLETGLAGRVMATRGIRTGSRAAAVGVGAVVLLNNWHKQELKQQFEQQVGADIGGRISNRRIERTVGVQAREVSDRIGVLLNGVSEELAALIIGYLAISQVDTVTDEMRQELRRLYELLRVMDTDDQLLDDEIDQRFDLMLRIKELEAQMGVDN